jgi:hypothetical protein
MTESERGTSLARLAVGAQLVLATVLALASTALGGAGSAEPGFAPRPLVLLATFAAPGVVGWLGASRRRPALLVASSIATLVGSFVAFSGITFIFLFPALLFALGAVQMEATRAPGGPRGIAGSLARGAASPIIAALLIGAGASVLLVTDSACWNTYQALFGVQFQLLPFSNALSVPPGAVSSGCSTGLISARGVGLAAVLWLAAFGLAHVASRRGNGGEITS